MSKRYEYVKTARIKRKQVLVDYLGGKCIICGYNKCLDAMDFHHLDPKDKKFTIASTWYTLEKCLNEVRKCVLVCSNCHREIHAGVVDISQYHQPFIEKIVVQQQLLKDTPRDCEQCGKPFTSRIKKQRFCSRLCQGRNSRRVKRPDKDVLLKQINELGFVGTGKVYGVSDNAIRKWIK